MKKIAILAAVAATLLVAASLASAKNFKQTGQIVGDKSAAVTLRVKVKHGKPRKVGGFKARNVRVRCNRGPSRITFSALQPIRVKHKKFKVRLSDGNGGILRIQGKVKRHGRETKGKLKTNRFKASDGQHCKAPKQKFKTSK